MTGPSFDVAVVGLMEFVFGFASLMDGAFSPKSATWLRVISRLVCGGALIVVSLKTLGAF